jgi:phage N-6-adenine-methyltransferase
MSLVGFKAENHPQQSRFRGAQDDVDDRATTREVFDPIAARFGGFTVDVAASEENTKCDRFYSLEDDGLMQSWAGERVWCNPPYSDLMPWIRKAWVEHATTEVIAMLLPANRTEQSWWQDMVEPYRDRPRSPLSVEFIAGRLRFLRAGQAVIGANERPPFGCCLLIWQSLAYRPDLGLLADLEPA